MVRTPFVDGTFDFWPLYDAGEWEPETKAVLERFLTPGSSFIDIGAWIGPVALWAVELGARVEAYEPDPVAYWDLVVNTSGKGVFTYRTAVTDHSGWAKLGNPRFFGDSQSRLSDEGTSVPCIPVNWLPIGTAALVKCDVEGHETVILPKLAELCRKYSVPLYLSWHQEWWPEPVSEDERRAWFEGFTLEPIRGDGWTGFSEMLAIP